MIVAKVNKFEQFLSDLEPFIRRLREKIAKRGKYVEIKSFGNFYKAGLQIRLYTNIHTGNGNKSIYLSDAEAKLGIF